MNKLAQFLSAKNTSQRAFAAELGVHSSVVSRFLSGAAMPSLATAFKIEVLTDGEVPASSWVRAKDNKPEDAA